MPITTGQAEVEKLCEEVISTIKVAANLNLDRRVARVVGRTLNREQIREECVRLLGESAHVSCNGCEIPKAHEKLCKG
jgi:hypothetical protein